MIVRGKIGTICDIIGEVIPILEKVNSPCCDCFLKVDILCRVLHADLWLFWIRPAVPSGMLQRATTEVDVRKGILSLNMPIYVLCP